MARSIGLRPHHVAIIAAAEQLPRTIPELARLERWTHMHGVRGYCFTKSRRYSPPSVASAALAPTTAAAKNGKPATSPKKATTTGRSRGSGL